MPKPDQHSRLNQSDEDLNKFVDQLQAVKYIIDFCDKANERLLVCKRIMDKEVWSASTHHYESWADNAWEATVGLAGKLKTKNKNPR